MLNINIEFEDPDEELTGYNMGHMTLHGDIGGVSSKNKAPSQAMMILLSLSELLDGLRRLQTTGNKQYEFIGDDSSFIVFFDKLEDGTVSVHGQNQEITRSDVKTIFASIFRDISNFLTNVLPHLPEDDIAYHDLNLSLSKFERFMEESGYKSEIRDRPR